MVCFRISIMVRSMDEIKNKKYMEAVTWNDYLIHRVNEDHILDLIQISESAFGISPSENYFRLKNNTSLFGDPFLGYIAFDLEGSPAAFYGVYACVIFLDGKDVRVVQSGDTMTHKQHMGKGLFTKLAQMTYDLCTELNYKFVFGFPNYNSYPGFIKRLNWVCPEKLNEYRIKVHTIPLMKLAKKVGILKPIYAVYLKCINYFYKVDSCYFENSVIVGGMNGVQRSKDFVDYKLACGNSFMVKIGGVTIWLKSDGFLYIGDIDISSNFNFNLFVKELKKYCFVIGADTISFISTPNTYLDNEFKKVVSPIEGLPYGWCDFGSNINFGTMGFVMADVDTF